jgi:surface antigen
VEKSISREAYSGSMASPNLGLRVPQPPSKLKLPKAAPLPPVTEIESASLTPVGKIATSTTKSVNTVAHTPRYLSHLSLIAMVAVVVLAGSTGHAARVSAIASQSPGPAAENVLDAAASAEVAAKVADKADLLVAHDATSHASTLNAQVALATSGSDTLANTQVVDTAGAVAQTSQTYQVQPGDTLGSIAEKFNITSNTIRWANNISDDTLKPGQSLLILPVSGLQYKVQPGDTADSLAAKYQSDAAQIVAFNNAEVNGLQVGSTIIIPDGVLAGPAPATASASAPAAPAAAPRASHASFVGRANGYSFGYCTWYVASRRAVPNSWGNASAWYYNAQADGYSVGSAPAVGAIAWSGAGYYGHVAYVESVSGGMVTVSEMNWNGNWDRVTYRTVPASTFRYIY